jgi:hypothetical protein
MLVDTINHIFDIDCTMSVDINNVSCIRGVTLQTRNSNRGEIWFCTVRLPNFPTLYAAASLDATPSTQPPSVPPPPPSTPRRRRRQPYPRPRLRPSRRAVAVANPIPDPTFGFDAAGGVPVVVPNPSPFPTPPHRHFEGQCCILLPSRSVRPGPPMIHEAGGAASVGRCGQAPGRSHCSGHRTNRL